MHQAVLVDIEFSCSCTVSPSSFSHHIYYLILDRRGFKQQPDQCVDSCNCKGVILVVILLSFKCSTVSSSINALVAVTVEDLIKPCRKMSEKHLFWMSKGLSKWIVLVCRLY